MTDHKPYFVLAFIIILGSFLRLYNIDVKMRFIWDEGRDMLAIRHMLVNRDLTLFGPFNEIDGSKDFFGVFHYYLMAPSLYLFNYDPLGPALFTASLGVLTIVLCFMLIKLWYDYRISLMVTTLYALSPLVVRYVQWPWNPNTTGFFSLLYLLSLTKLHTTKKTRWVIFSGLLLGLLFQLHYFTLPLGIVWLMVMLAQRNNKTFLHGLLFVSFFLLPNLSFVLFDLTHEHFYWNILRESFVGNTKQQYFSFNIFTVLLSFWKTTLSVYTDIFGTIFSLGILTTIIYWTRSLFVWISFSKSHKVTLEFLLGISWIGYCLVTSLLPGLADSYHAIPYVVGLVLSLVLSATTFLKSRYFVASFVLLSGCLMYLNYPFRALSWEENMPVIREMSATISKQVTHPQFNIASLVDPDTTAVRFRYFLDVFGSKPQANNLYSESQELFVVVRDFDSDFRQNPAWELSTFKRAYPSLVGTVSEYQIWKLEKTR